MILTENPFYILDVSPLDNKRIIHEKAEEKILFEEEELCRNAERVLLNTQKRLDAEISWIPADYRGSLFDLIDEKNSTAEKTEQIIQKIQEDAKKNIFDYEYFEAWNTLSYANVIAFFLSKITDDSWTEDEVEDIVREFCDTVNKIDIADVIDLINKDRSVAGFPEITDYDTADDAWNNQYRYYKDVLYNFLNLFDSCFIVNVLTSLIEDITDNGDEECPWQLLEDIIVKYEIDVNPFFEKQEEKIDADIEIIISALEQKKENNQLFELFEALKNDVLLWDRIAQPIQVLLKSQGLEHNRSDDISDSLRSLALTAHNDFGCTELSLKITELQQYVFAELRAAAEKAADDKKQLEEIVKQQDVAKRENELLQKIENLAKQYKNITVSGRGANAQVLSCIEKATPIINQLQDANEGRNYLTILLRQNIIEYVNKKHDYRTALNLLRTITELTSDPEILGRLEKDKQTVLSNIQMQVQSQQAHKDAKKTTLHILGWTMGICGIIGLCAGGCGRGGHAGEGLLCGLGFGFLLSLRMFLGGRR